MIRRIGIAYVVELAKAMRLWHTYVGPILVVLAVLGAELMQPIVRDNVSDYAFIAYATPAALNLLGLLLVLIYCSGLVSSEMSSGTIRTVLVRPLRRWEFLAAKLLLGMTYAATLTLLVGMVTWLLVFVFGDIRGVSYGDEVIFTTSEMRDAYLLGMLLSLAPLCAAVAYAVMLSTLTRHSAAAIGASIGLWLVVDIAKHPLHFSAYVFSTYFETPWAVFANRSQLLDAAWFPTAKLCLVTSLASAFAFMIIAGYVLSRRNLHA